MCDVLVLDDQEGVRAVMVEVLEDDGLTVWSVASPDAARAAAREAFRQTELVRAVRELPDEAS